MNQHRAKPDITVQHHQCPERAQFTMRNKKTNFTVFWQMILEAQPSGSLRFEALLIAV